MTTTATTRPTVASLAARQDALDAHLGDLITSVQALTRMVETTLGTASPSKAKATVQATVSAPAQTRRCKGKTAEGKRCKRMTSGKFCTSHTDLDKAVPAPKVTKGAQAAKAAHGTLGRSEWNKTVSAKARLAGKRADGTSVLSHVLADWTAVQAMRTEGLTPDEVVAKFA